MKNNIKYLYGSWMFIRKPIPKVELIDPDKMIIPGLKYEDYKKYKREDFWNNVKITSLAFVLFFIFVNFFVFLFMNLL